MILPIFRKYPVYPTPVRRILSFAMGCASSHSAEKGRGSYPLLCDESIMKTKAHGSCEHSVFSELRWGCDFATADRICCYNRHYAEPPGYFESTSFLSDIHTCEEITFYDSVSGKPLFIAPKDRSVEDFLKVLHYIGHRHLSDETLVFVLTGISFSWLA